MSGLRKFLVSLGLIVVLLVVGVAVAALLHLSSPKVPKTEVSFPPQLVDTIELVAQDRVERIVGYGTARADQVATLTAEVSASVVKLVNDLEAGMRVEKGQALVRLDDRESVEQLHRARQLAAADQAQIDQLAVERENTKKLIAIAKAKVAITESERRRLEALFRESNAAQTEYNLTQFAHQQALQYLQGLENQLALIDPRTVTLEASRQANRNAAAIAQLNVDRCRVAAPFGGQIDALMVEVGDSVLPGTPVLRLISPDRIEVPIEFGVSLRDRVRLEASCVLSVDSMPAVRWEGVVSRIAPSADERSRTFAVYVEVDNKAQDRPLVPGYFVRAQVDGPLLRAALVVPRGAIVDGRLFVADDGKARARSVQVERLLEDQAVVTGDVEPGERVIVTNLDVLHDGAPIRTPTHVGG